MFYFAATNITADPGESIGKGRYGCNKKSLYPACVHSVGSNPCSLKKTLDPWLTIERPSKIIIHRSRSALFMCKNVIGPGYGKRYLMVMIIKSSLCKFCLNKTPRQIRGKLGALLTNYTPLLM